MSRSCLLGAAILAGAVCAHAQTPAPAADIDLGEQVTPVKSAASSASTPNSISPLQWGRAGVPFGAAQSNTANVEPPSPIRSDPPRKAHDIDVERFEYKGRPIRAVLVVGRERMITFPNQIQLQAPKGFESFIRIEAIDKTVYVTALTHFPGMRILVRETESEERIFPLDLTSEKGSTASAELQVISPTTKTKGGETDTGAPPAPVDAVTLTRYAARMLYAPRRLTPTTPGVVQIPVNTSQIHGLYRGARIAATPIGAWRSGDLYVTAVKLTNLGGAVTPLNLDEIRGKWLTATAQHRVLGKAGSDEDTTAVYLVCDQPFEACK